MNATQPQLLQIPLDLGDVVYTPDWVARDMVEFFKPSGRILEPCKGDGVFLKYLPPHTEWCEIQEGRDFFAWSEPVDWIISNPPYRTFDDFLTHGYRVARNCVWLVPLKNFFTAHLRILRAWEYGWLKNMRIYGTGGRLGFPMGNSIGALHFQRGYTGPMYTTIYDGVPM